MKILRWRVERAKGGTNRQTAYGYGYLRVSYLICKSEQGGTYYPRTCGAISYWMVKAERDIGDNCLHMPLAIIEYARKSTQTGPPRLS